MWQTELKNIARNQLVLAKIKPITWIDGGYQLGFIHLDTGLFSIQNTAISIGLERVERWITMDDLERVLEHSAFTEAIWKPSDNPWPGLDPSFRDKMSQFMSQVETKYDKDGKPIRPQPIFEEQVIAGSSTGHAHQNTTSQLLEIETDQPSLRPMRQGIKEYDFGGEG